MIYIGIDPGNATGAVAFIDTFAGSVHLKNMPPNAAALASYIEQQCALPELHSNVVAVIEKVHAMPPAPGRKAGTQSSFKFGESFGTIKGVCAGLGIDYTLLTPGAWQKMLGLQGKFEDRKQVHLEKAQQLYGSHLKITKRAADALLLAHCCKLIGHEQQIQSASGDRGIHQRD